MKKIHIITPVKDSIELTLQTLEAVTSSRFTIPYTYTVYNDYSTPENTKILKEASERLGFTLVNLEDITDHPSPNYLLVLQIAQEKAIEEEAALCIVESDVTVKPDTLQTLFDETLQRPDCGMSAAITTDAEGIINYPYLYAQEGGNSDFSTEECLSFCCTILSLPFLQKYSFNQLNPAKDWHDAVLTKVSLKLAFRNYLFPHLPVLHSPHGSRPWRKFKEKNLFKYYLYKFTGRRHKMVDPSSN